MLLNQLDGEVINLPVSLMRATIWTTCSQETPLPVTTVPDHRKQRLAVYRVPTARDLGQSSWGGG
jgi:hypothetical protein